MSDPLSVEAAARPDETEAPQRRRAPWHRGRVVRSLSWLGTAGVACYAAVRLFGLETGWLLITTVAFTPYMVVAALLGAGLQALVRHWRAVAVTAVLALAMAVAAAPRAIGSEQPAAAGVELKAMTVNLYVGEANLEYIVDLVDEHRPDLLSVQETTPYALDELAALGLEDRMPHVIATTGWAAEGTTLYSRHPVERLERYEPDGTFHQVAAEVTLPDDTSVRFMAVHTAAPLNRERIPEWERDFEQLPRPEADVPWILAGDFNATLDHHAMRELIASGYVDAADATGEGLAATWRPIDGGRLRGLLRPPPITLDHVLVDERIAVLDLEVLDKRGSDHAPVVASIRLP
ncbi:endonuclease/exonuclease/phosphatase family protein [Glycomyces halotolerans]